MTALVTLPPHESKHFTVTDVQRMADAGMFDNGERVELLEGELVVVSPQSPAHFSVIDEIAERLRHAFDFGMHVRQQAPLLCGPYSAPEPDVSVVRGHRRDYVTRHPQGADCVLAVEVAVTSQSMDRAKAEIYARADVSEYWLVDLPSSQLTRYARPDGSRAYLQVDTLSAQDFLTGVGVGEAIRVGDLLID